VPANQPPEQQTDPAPEPAGDNLEEGKGSMPPDDTQGSGTGQPQPLATTRQLMEAELAAERRRSAVLLARDTARRILAEALNDGWVPPLTQIRITESLMRDLPMTEANLLDEAELVKRAGRELAQAEREIAEAMSAAGVGKPRDLGFSESGIGGGLGAAELDRRLEDAFTGLGLPASTAKIAAKGRD
jgi:hypothetical protein